MISLGVVDSLSQDSRKDRKDISTDINLWKRSGSRKDGAAPPGLLRRMSSWFTQLGRQRSEKSIVRVHSSTGKKGSKIALAKRFGRRRVSVSWASLPEELLSNIASFLTVDEHFSILAKLSRQFDTFLSSADSTAWPPVLVLNEDRKGVVTMTTCKQRRVVCPDSELVRLGRLGFARIEGCGPRSLKFLANPCTKQLCSFGISLTDVGLAPIAGMAKLEQLELSYCQGSSQAAADLRQLSGLQLQSLCIHDQLNNNVLPVVLNERSLAVLNGMPLKRLSLLLTSPTEQRARFENVMPTNLAQLEDLEVRYYHDMNDLCFAFLRSTYPYLRRLGVFGPDIHGWGLQDLAGLPIQELDLSFTGISDQHIHFLEGLPLRKLNLAVCGGISNAGMEALRRTNCPLTDLNLAYTMVQDLGIQALQGLPIQKLDLTGCAISGASIKALEDIRLPLKELVLAHTPLDDAALTPLRTMRLERVVLRGTKATLKGSQVVSCLPCLRSELRWGAVFAYRRCLHDPLRRHGQQLLAAVARDKTSIK
eukprot:g68082.t1